MAEIFKKVKSKVHFVTQGGSGSVLGVSGEPKPQTTSHPSSSHPSSSSPVTTQPTARPQSSSSRTAGVAALSRFENKTKGPQKHPVSGSSMLSEARRELEKENKLAQIETDRVADKVAKKLISDQPSMSAIGAARVILDCPITGNSVEYEQRLTHLQNILQDMYLQEPLYGSCLMIHTLGTNSPLTTHLLGTSVGLIEKDKLSACIETISKCLKNILEHPNEDKYRSIRCGSKALKEKVLPVTGAELFLSAVGFVQEHREFQGNEEMFYILDTPAERVVKAKADVVVDSQDYENTQSVNVTIVPKKQIDNKADIVVIDCQEDDVSKPSDDVMISSDGVVISSDEPISKEPDVMVDELTKQLEHLSTALDLLTNVTPVKLVLNRDVRVYKASTSVNRFPELPSSFFILKPDEVKKESQLKREQVEVNEMLLTRGQREKLEQQATRQYQFCVIRVRLPEGLILQATFRAKEKLSDVFYFISQSLYNEATLFSLFHQGGKKLENMNLSLQEAELVPAALINVRIDLGTHTEGILKPSLKKKIEIMN